MFCQSPDPRPRHSLHCSTYLRYSIGPLFLASFPWEHIEPILVCSNQRYRSLRCCVVLHPAIEAFPCPFLYVALRTVTVLDNDMYSNV
jgi:hypothetical protein